MEAWSGLLDISNLLEDIEEPENIIHIPQVRQPDSYTCGVAAVLSVLCYYGMEVGYEDLAKAVKATKADGVDHRNILKYLQEKGLEVELHKGMLLSDLQSFIDAETPVIVVLQAWSTTPANYENDWDNGHYAVVVGYDANNIYLMDPATLGHYTYIPREEFAKRWHDQDQDIKLRQAGIVINATKRYNEDEIKRLQ